MAINNSLSNQCFCKTKSALDKNLKAKANSKNPNDTLTVFNHPPDFGNEFIQPGNMANNIKGNAMADEKPNIPTIGPIPPCLADSPNKEPTIGPVHENETTAKANAIKKIPMIPPLSACLSILFKNEFGKTISNAPKNEAAKTIRITKNIKLNQTLVDNAFRESIPKSAVISIPKPT